MFSLPLCHWSSQLFDLRTPSSTDVPVLLLNQPHPNIPFRRNKQSKKKVRRKEGRDVNSNNNNKIITNFPEFFEFITNTAPQVSNSIYRQNFMEIILLNIIIFPVEDILGSEAQWSRRRPSAQMCQVRVSVKPFFFVVYILSFYFCFVFNHIFPLGLFSFQFLLLAHYSLARSFGINNCVCIAYQDMNHLERYKTLK